MDLIFEVENFKNIHIILLINTCFVDIGQADMETLKIRERFRTYGWHIGGKLFNGGSDESD